MRKRYLIVLFLIIFSLTSFAEENTPTNTEGNSVTKVEEKSATDAKEKIVTKTEEKSPVKTEEKDVTNLKEIVVTATRTEKSIADVPGSVSVVTANEMKKRNIQSIDEALNLLPGVFDNRLKGLMGTTSTVTFRGLSGSGRSLLLIDGMPMNDAYSSSQQWGGIYAQDLQSIEVVRGPSSSLYGGAAMGGVANLMTAMPEKREFSLSTGYGNSFNGDEAMRNLWSNHLSYGDKIGKFRLYTALGYRSTDGYPTGQIFSSYQPSDAGGWTQTTNNTGATKYLVGDSGDNGWWDYTGSVRVQYDFSDTTNIRFSWLRAAYKYTYEDPHTYLTKPGDPYTDTPAKLTQKSFLAGDGSTITDSYTINADALLGNVKGKFLFGINNEKENWYNTPVTATLAGGTGTKSDSPSRTYFTDLQLSAPIMEKHVLTGGFSFRYDTADSNNFPLSNYEDPDSVSGASTQWGGGITKTYSAYLQAEIALLNSLTLYAGVRDDYWVSSDGYAGQTGSASFSSTFPEKTQNAVSPKGALVWKPLDGTTFRVSGGKAFRAPSLNQLYKTWVSDSTTLQTIYNSNPDLNPETVLSWDAGVEQNLWKGAKIKATYFENYIKDMIYDVKTGSTTSGGKTTTTMLYTNVGKAETKGVELEVEQNFGKYLRLFAGYTHTDSDITDYNVNPALVGKSLTQVPQNMVDAGIDISYGPASLLTTWRYVSKRYGQDDNSDSVSGVYGSYDPYAIMDMKASYKVTNWATVSLSINNVTNEQYFVYYVAPGISWFGQLEIKF
jgi:iron complex outermembrane receptor protein